MVSVVVTSKALVRFCNGAVETPCKDRRYGTERNGDSEMG